MRETSFYVAGLLELADCVSESERRTLLRQSLHSLAHTTQEDGPRPLDALDPQRLLASVKVALADGLFDDLDWLAADAAACVLYDLAASIPAGQEQRELGRRMLARFHGGNAATFAALATRIARGNAKLLFTPAARVRLALLGELPLLVSAGDGPLALAIVSRRELAKSFLEDPSVGALAARRLAARLLEKAARESATQARLGDTHSAARAFTSDLIRPCWERLLADREPLVWRHVAIARGLIAPNVPEFDAAIARGLDPKGELALHISDWRRAAVSHAARIAVDPEVSWHVIEPLVERDSGVLTAFFWGLCRAYEAEPEATETIIVALVRKYGYAAIEGLCDFRRECGHGPSLERMFGACLRELPEAKPESDEFAAAALAEALADIYATPRVREPLRDILERGLDAFATVGTAAAAKEGEKLLSRACEDLSSLDGLPDLDDASVSVAATRSTLSVLRDIDVTLLERAALDALLAVGGNAAEAKGHEETMVSFREDLGEWLFSRESDDAKGASAPVHLRRLRCLLHVVDGEVSSAEESAVGPRVRGRWLRLVRSLVSRVEAGPPRILRRAILATIARALDAVLRAETVECTDVILLIASSLHDASDFDALAEASMNHDLEQGLQAYAAFMRVVQPPGATGRFTGDGLSDSLLPPPIARPPDDDFTPWLFALDTLSQNLAGDGAARAEALRRSLVKLGGGLRSVAHATSLRALCNTAGEPEALATTEAAVYALAQLVVSARGRFDSKTRKNSLPPPSQPLTMLVGRVITGADARLRDHRVQSCAEALTVHIPAALRVVVMTVLMRVATLPTEQGSADAGATSSTPLPAWVPPRRTLGGFYLVRALGTGAAGSVFLVSRVEDRHDAAAEQFALKVPEFSPSAAQLLTEEEFMRLFREEASALLGIPEHPNLARFVTFDLGARPKPILVMEYVEGGTLEHAIAARTLTVERALAYLDDVLAGLNAMHSVGLGHLDVKPSNVIVRGGERAVLVDFGLSGRKIRLGCATGPYGAPEVWGALTDVPLTEPGRADVYAFGCLAYEMLVGHPLFQGPNEVALVAQHVSHDGQPPGIRKLADAGEAEIAELLFTTLRQRPEKRVSTTELRDAMRRLAPRLEKKSWPLGS